MNGRYLISAVAVALLTVGCGYSIKTATDYDRSVKFSNYNSFFFMKGNSSGNPLLDQRASAAVRRIEWCPVGWATRTCLSDRRRLL
jgi:hypothetical protein